MALLASDVMARAAVHLNDRAQATFTNTILLPKLQTAWDEFESVLAEHGVSTMRKATSAAISVSANAKNLAAPPGDLLYPVEMWERGVGENDDQWVPMKERAFLPKRSQSDTLEDWAWDGDAVLFVGCDNDREVCMNYQATLSTISGDGSAISVVGSKNFLSYRTAALQAASLKNNDLASYLESKAERALEVFLNTRAKEGQSLPVRRKPYRYGVMLRRKRRF